ncbi:hypothetical protein WJX84_007362 [Apatococcus fuscideae]|uniref:Uncharacterized protein n=1 Tax=Apatococcus fuscideae TaxID=2026836 RepID=A0AAW1SPY3_9CHLO
MGSSSVFEQNRSQPLAFATDRVPLTGYQIRVAGLGEKEGHDLHPATTEILAQRSTCYKSIGTRQAFAAWCRRSRSTRGLLKHGCRP